MDRKGIFLIVVAALVLLTWQIFFAARFAPPTPPPGAAASPSPSASETAAAASGSPTTIAPAPIPAAAAQPKVAEQFTEASGPVALYRFTNLGGGIASAELTRYPAESGSNVDLNAFGSLPIGALSETPGEGGDVPYVVSQQGNDVLCIHDQTGGLSIAKKFHLPQSVKDANGYLMTLDVTFTDRGPQPVKSGGYYMYIGSGAAIHQRDLSLYTSFDWYGQGGKSNDINVNWFNAGRIPLLNIETRPERPVYQVDADGIGWAAANSQFFTTVVAPQNGATGGGVWARRFPIKIDDHDLMGIEGALRLPAFLLQPGQSLTQTVAIYAGPKIYGVLAGLGDGQEHILNFGLYAPISVFLLGAMNWIHGWTGNYAIAIILLTVAIRGALWPLQNKATASMRQMQELQPRMTELKEKYKDDPTRMNQEVMKLYKEYKVNPLAGCLPMLIQIPIFFAFYRVLGTAIELRNSKFLWVHDLSQPDTVFHIGTFPVNILPLCMAATMLVQMAMQPKSGDKSQQRMFMFMPLIFIVICYNYASALALYWTVSNLCAVTQMYVTRRRTAPAPLKPVAAKRKSR